MVGRNGDGQLLELHQPLRLRLRGRVVGMAIGPSQQLPVDQRTIKGWDEKLLERCRGSRQSLKRLWFGGALSRRLESVGRGLGGDSTIDKAPATAD